MQFHPYLTFDGRCEEAFRFYERVLGGEIQTMQTHGGSPIADETPADWHDLILHASMRVGDAWLMGSDSPPGYHADPQGVHVSIHLDDPAEADRVFRELADGGKVTMPIDRTFWAERFGMLVDRFGIPWMVNCEPAS